MALCRLPVNAREPHPLRSRARRRAKQPRQLLQACRFPSRSRPIRTHAQVIVVGLVRALAKLRAQQRHGRAGGFRQIEKLAGILHHGHARIVAPVAVDGAKPEKFVAANAAAHAQPPHRFVVRWRIRRRSEIRRCRRAGVFDPLREWVPRSPGILPVEVESLAVQRIAAALRVDAGAPAGRAHALSLHIS